MADHCRRRATRIKHVPECPACNSTQTRDNGSRLANRPRPIRGLAMIIISKETISPS
jgi:hypothetical protein